MSLFCRTISGAVLVLFLLGVIAPLEGEDCNGNFVDDSMDIVSGLAEDCNLNGVPDVCEGPAFGFSESVLLDFESTTRAVVSADFNGDDLTDLAIGYVGGIAVRFGTQAGEFESSLELRFTVDIANPVGFGCGDFDGDGDVDLVALETSRLLVVENVGDGMFAAGAATDLTGRAFQLAAADFNRDGAADLVVTDVRNDRVNVLFATVASQFSPAVSYEVGDDPRNVGVGDLDGDGASDIVVLNRLSADLTLLYNDGTGGFSQSETIEGLGERLSVQTHKLVVTDLTGDGLADLAIGDNEISVRRNEGQRSFSPPTPLLVSSVEVAALGAGDIDGDGDVDLVASYSQPAESFLFVFTNGGAGAFNAGVAALPPPAPISQILVHDADTDRINDLVLVPSVSNSVVVAWNRVLDNAVPFESVSTYPSIRPHTADSGDMDGDGDLDVVLGHNGGPLSVMFNDGTGAFVDRVVPNSGGVAWTTKVADFNNDGHLDIAAGRIVTKIYTNNGLGRFAITEVLVEASGPWHLTAEDIDANGWVDVIASLAGRNTVRVVFNAGAGSFDRFDEYSVGSTPRSSATADLDGDGDIDIATSNFNSWNVSILENDGTGRFEPAVTFPVTGGPTYVAAADFDGDGHVDLVTANEEQSEVSFLWNAGGGVIEFEPAVATSAAVRAYSLLAIDLNGDDRPDVACCQERSVGETDLPARISILANRGRREFLPPNVFLTGDGPRFIVAGDMDGDLDVDVASANRESGDLTVFLSGLAGSPMPDFLESVCTAAEYFDLSVRSRVTSSTHRNGKYVLAARDDPSLHPALFQNVERFRLHEDFLAQVFPDELGFVLEDPARYAELVGRRGTRDYYVGAIDLRQNDDGFFYTFNIVTDTGFDPREVLSQAEVGEVYERISRHFLLRPLAYAPTTQAARDEAESWVDPEFPMFIDDAPSPFQFEAYTLGLGYGRLRLLTLEEFEVANRQGRFTFQDGVVIEEVSPPDIEGVVGFVFTGGVQGELAHLPIRTARRGTPNAFVARVREKFAEFEGELVRVEVFPENFFVTRVDASEAEEFWSQVRRKVPERPFIDGDYTPLDSFLSMDLAGRPEGRYGGKATNLARLQHTILGDGTMNEFLEAGFSIPIHYYRQFMQTNFRGAQSYEEYIQEILTREDVRTDSELRFELLSDFRDVARATGVADGDLVQRLAPKIEAVFGDLATMVRFRSSSNAEDALVFNGAGLYESTSVCALDTLDTNELNFSYCDPTRNSERTIERALKKVWTSLWTFRAHEERSFYQIDPNDVVMGIAVTRAFLNEDANGVAFTGSSRDVDDKRYVITAQIGEGSVVSPPAGTTVERTLLEVNESGEVENIVRSRASNQVQSGEFVMQEPALRDLARFMWQVESAWEFDIPEGISHQQVILDFEFKLEPDGSLAVKQVRPFLIPAPDLRTPTFELEIPGDTLLCGVFAPDIVGRPLEEADPQMEYELKSQVRLHSGLFELPTDGESLTLDLIAEVRFGSERELVEPLGEGTFEFQTAPQEGSQTSYIFSYSQEFVLASGESFEVKIDNLRFTGRGSIALKRRLLLDDEYNTFSLSMQAAVDGVPRVVYSSCSYRELPRWELGLELEGGSELSLVERFLAEESVTKTGRASVVEATVELEGERQVVRDYWRLVYASRRHNVDVKYWVVLEPELRLPSLQRPVQIVEVSGLDGLESERYECLGAEVRYLDADFNVIEAPRLASCLKAVTVDPGEAFLRGDVDGNTSLTVGDAVVTLRYLFARGESPACLKSADTTDDGRLDVADAVSMLLHLFGGVSSLPAPFGVCGTDPTPDDLPCAAGCTGSRL